MHTFDSNIRKNQMEPRNLGPPREPFLSHQHLPCTRQKLMNLLFGSVVDHVHRPHAVGASQTRRRSKEAADEGTFPVNLAAVLAQVRTAQLGQRVLMFGLGLDG